MELNLEEGVSRRERERETLLQELELIFGDLVLNVRGCLVDQPGTKLKNCTQYTDRGHAMHRCKGRILEIQKHFNHDESTSERSAHPGSYRLSHLLHRFAST